MRRTYAALVLGVAFALASTQSAAQQEEYRGTVSVSIDTRRETNELASAVFRGTVSSAATSAVLEYGPTGRPQTTVAVPLQAPTPPSTFKTFAFRTTVNVGTHYQARVIAQLPDQVIGSSLIYYTARLKLLRPAPYLQFGGQRAGGRVVLHHVDVVDGLGWTATAQCKACGGPHRLTTNRTVRLFSRRVALPARGLRVVLTQRKAPHDRLVLKIYRYQRYLLNGCVYRRERCPSISIVLSQGALKTVIADVGRRGKTIVLKCRGSGCPSSVIRRHAFGLNAPVQRFEAFRRLGLGAQLSISIVAPGYLGVGRTLHNTTHGPRLGPYRCLRPSPLHGDTSYGVSCSRNSAS